MRAYRKARAWLIATPAAEVAKAEAPYFKDIDLDVLDDHNRRLPEARQLEPARGDHAPGLRGDPRHLPARQADHQAAQVRRRRCAAAGGVTDMAETLGWIGIGSMGHRMTRHLLLPQGIRWWLRTPSAPSARRSRRAIAKSNAEVAALADTIILSLPDGKRERSRGARDRRRLPAQGQDRDRHLHHRHQGGRGRGGDRWQRPASRSSTRRCRVARRAPTRPRSPSCWPVRPKPTSASSR